MEFSVHDSFSACSVRDLVGHATHRPVVEVVRFLHCWVRSSILFNTLVWISRGKSRVANTVPPLTSVGGSRIFCVRTDNICLDMGRSRRNLCCDNVDGARGNSEKK